eukprot:192281-Prymnesium_polylepis.1
MPHTERVCEWEAGEGGFSRAGLSLGLRASATSSGSSMQRRRCFPVAAFICTSAPSPERQWRFWVQAH